MPSNQRQALRLASFAVRLMTLALALVAGMPVASAAESPATPRERWVVDPKGLSRAEQTLLATLQGVLNEKEATLWLRSSGMSDVIIEQLKGEGVALHD